MPSAAVPYAGRKIVMILSNIEINGRPRQRPCGHCGRFVVFTTKRFRVKDGLIIYQHLCSRCWEWRESIPLTADVPSSGDVDRNFEIPS